jgi:hypothetical protein
MLTLDRRPEREREIAGRYCHGRGETRAVRELVKFAHARAMPGPVQLPAGRNLILELQEELADGVNYATWAALAGEMTDERASRICGHLAEAWRLAAGAAQ